MKHAQRVIHSHLDERCSGAHRMSPINSLQQHRELRRAQRYAAAVCLRPNKTPALQTLGHQAKTRAIPPQHLKTKILDETDRVRRERMAEKERAARSLQERARRREAIKGGTANQMQCIRICTNPAVKKKIGRDLPRAKGADGSEDSRSHLEARIRNVCPPSYACLDRSL